MTRPVTLGGGHCCQCSRVCHHIDGPWLCARHRAQAASVAHCPGCLCGQRASWNFTAAAGANPIKFNITWPSTAAAQ